MQYEFSFGSLFLGLIILAVGIAFMRWYQVIADNMGSGVVSYDRYKLYALITCIIGIVVSVNLHWFILSAIVNMIFHRS